MYFSYESTPSISYVLLPDLLLLTPQLLDALLLELQLGLVLLTLVAQLLYGLVQVGQFAQLAVFLRLVDVVGLGLVEDVEVLGGVEVFGGLLVERDDALLVLPLLAPLVLLEQVGVLDV